MPLPLPLRTERLTLRPLTAADLEDHARLYGNPEVVRYLYDEPLDLEASKVHLDRRLQSPFPDDGAWLNLAVERDGEYLGEVGVVVTSTGFRQCEVGYVFRPDVAGHGYATEATRAMVDLAFTTLNAHRVAGRIDARNNRSAAVLERLGMRREAHLVENEFVKGEWTDEVVYAITEDEWSEQR